VNFLSVIFIYYYVKDKESVSQKEKKRK